jgi:translation initiation factor IF-1
LSDHLEFNGVVVEAANSQFKVKVTGVENYIVTCTLAGKIRVNGIRILLGDRVTIQVSAYNLKQGRIVFRHKS